jgi:hypothetical protein
VPTAGGAAFLQLADLRGLRSAPPLDGPQAEQLREELRAALDPFPWFTIGVMAPTAALALACLRRWERALGWSPLATATEAAGVTAGAPDDAPVFLKGNQRTGTFLLRHEQGLGEGVLITGQNSDAPSAGETWGPLPLDLF